MGSRSVPTLAYRLIATVLVAALVTGASWAPAAGPLQCDACRRDVTGNVVCRKRQQARSAGAAHACCKTGQASGVQGTHGDRSQPDPAKCPPCCVPQPHAPVPAASIVTYHSAFRCIEIAPETCATAASAGVHESIFHPPRA
jgi:hypothetical protein